MTAGFFFAQILGLTLIDERAPDAQEFLAAGFD